MAARIRKFTRVRVVYACMVNNGCIQFDVFNGKVKIGNVERSKDGGPFFGRLLFAPDRIKGEYPGPDVAAAAVLKAARKRW